MNQTNRIIIVGVILLLIAGAGFYTWMFVGGGRERGASVGPGSHLGAQGLEVDPASPSLVIVASGDTAGWMVPCGCASGQSGGLLRRGSLIDAERKEHRTVVVDAGGAPGGTAKYDQLKFTAIVNGELKMGLEAHNIGGPEAALGLDELQRLQQDVKVPFLSANLRDSKTGELPFEPIRIIQANGRRLAFIGVLSQRYAGLNWKIDEPREAILEALKQHKDQFDWAIVLAYLPEAELRELATSLPEVHAIVGGPTGQSIAPVMVGPVLLASATNKGKFVVRLNVPRPGEKTPWTGDSLELTKQFKDDTPQEDILRDFRQYLAGRDLTAADSGLVASLGTKLPDDYRIEGNESCRECHKQDHEHWLESSHSKAWETLLHKDVQMDSYCQQCHTTGFGLPGGFQSARTSRDRTSVGCESCHGPSHAHATDPKVKTPFVAKDQCTRCHDHENSPQFEYATYWPKIKHGEAKKP